MIAVRSFRLSFSTLQIQRYIIDARRTGRLWAEFVPQVRLLDAFTANEMDQMPIGSRLSLPINAIGLGTIV